MSEQTNPRRRTAEAPPELTPFQKLRRMAAIRAIADGTIDVPLRCGWCRSTSIIRAVEPITRERGYRCLPCGRLTTDTTVHRLRQQEIRAVIVEGIDP